jgi:hypothetical protein
MNVKKLEETLQKSRIKIDSASSQFFMTDKKIMFESKEEGKWH